ncbi:hypothetical protein Mapa_004178 [Marchantia paleacea]|nr:hypothetical protein Mapa_004178 [Marchantia paleacea]
MKHLRKIKWSSLGKTNSNMNGGSQQSNYGQNGETGRFLWDLEHAAELRFQQIVANRKISFLAFRDS